MLRSINNQIIMVTLKDSTVAKSDLIFGVYPKNGISQVVKYNHPSKVKVEAQWFDLLAHKRIDHKI